jgi:hypothetical protein
VATSLDEAMKDAHEQRCSYDVDVACTDCGDAAIVRFLNGEPVDESAMHCHCGGAMEEI